MAEGVLSVLSPHRFSLLAVPRSGLVLPDCTRLPARLILSDHRAARLSLVLYVCVRVCVEGGSLQRVSINSNPSLACV